MINSFRVKMDLCEAMTRWKSPVIEVRAFRQVGGGAEPLHTASCENRKRSGEGESESKEREECLGTEEASHRK